MGPPDADLRQRRERVFGTGSTLFYDDPVELVRGEGVHLFDAEGRRYLDMYNNVPCVGHGNPRVAEAVGRQAATLNVHSRYLHEGVVEYAERLVSLHHEQLDTMVYACTGTEANEVAIMMARAATGGTGIICTDAAYHGNSAEVGKLTGAGSRRDPDVRAVRFPQRYRPLAEGLSDTELCDRYLADVETAIADLAAAGTALAGMLVCPLFANEGLPDVPAGYLAGAAERVRAAGGVFIADEVQAGFCRTGRWWGYELGGVEPDVVTMGKPMGNGVPVAAVAARRDLMETFRARTRYFNTFAGSPLQAAAASAVLDVIEEEDLPSRVVEVGDHLRSAVRAVDHEAIGDVRGTGQFTSIELVTDRRTRTPDPEVARRVVNLLRRDGVLTSTAGVFDNVVKLRPPLVFGREDADEFLAVFPAVMDEASR